jgi:hypothetical protein
MCILAYLRHRRGQLRCLSLGIHLVLQLIHGVMCVISLCFCFSNRFGNSSCCAVLRFHVNIEISLGWTMVTRVRPFLCGCCLNDDLAGFVLCLVSVRGMQVLMGILVFVWQSQVMISPP